MFYGIVQNVTLNITILNSVIYVSSKLATISAGLVYQTAKSTITINGSTYYFNLVQNATGYVAAVVQKATNATISVYNSTLFGELIGTNVS